MNRQIGWSTESNLLWQIGNQIDRMTGVIGSTLSTFVPQSRTLTINGVTYDLSANRSWTVATGLSGTIATGQVAFASATNTISGTNNLFWDAANSRLGIGTNTPVSSVDVLINNSSPSYDSINLKNTNANGKTSTNLLNNNNEGGSFGTYGTTFGAISFRNNFAVGATKSVIFLTDGNLATGGTSPILFIIGGYDNTPQMTLNGSGRLLLGTTTDGGQRLQVQGDAFIKGSGATSATIALTVQNSSSNSLLTLSNAGEFQLFGANNLLIQPTDTNPTSVVYSGRNTVFYNYTTNQAATIGSFIFNGANFTHQSANSIVFNILKGIAPTGGTGTFSLFSISSTINQTGGANGITRGLYVNPTLTAAADWRSIEWSNNTGWGLYGAGTALNYLGGSLGIKTTSPYSPSTFSLDVNGGLLVKNTAGTTAQITLINANPALGGNEGFIVHSVGGTSTSSFAQLQGYYGLSIAGSTAIRLNPLGGSVIVNSTTNSGEQFQVTGDARITGTIYQDGAADALFNFQNAGANKWRIGNAFVSGSNYFQLYDSVSNLERIRWNNNSTATFTSDITFIGGSNAVATFQSTQPDVKIQASGASNAVSLSLVPSNGFEGVIQNNVTNGFIQVKTASTTRVTFKNGGQVNFQPLAADPAGAGAGDVYYNSGTNKLRLYDGTSWVDLN